MPRKSNFHQFISLAVSLGLLLQLIVPVATIIPVASVHAQPLAQDQETQPIENEAQTAVSTTNQPTVLAPLTLAKAQSTFQADGTAVITYTLRNTLAPTIRPNATSSDTITDTVAAINATNFAADPNTIRDAQLTLQLTNVQTSLQSSSLPVDQDGDNFSFNLGDIPPLSAAKLVVELTIPASVADFVDLDTGATGNGRFQSILVSTNTSPIRVAPDGFAQWLTCTVDANCADPFVIRQATELGHDPTAIFEFVRDLGYESYEGSLRGARGTLWSEAGNGYDQSSLLIALLRASGIPAAYRLGSLDTGDAQTLISSMFPATTAASGLIPAGSAVADPANDAALIAEAQDHAWVEAYFPGSGWTTIDAAFATAQPGTLFGTISGGQLPELPDNTRHKVTVSLEVEKYSQFPIAGTNLYTINPLSTTLNTVELAGEPLVFAHLVDSSDQTGMVFATAEHTYTPYFVVGISERLVEGEPFGEILSSFPFAQDFVVGEWLDFTVTNPSGDSETFRRELFDDIGYEVRAGNGLISDMERDSTPRLSLISSWTTLFAAYDVPEEAINDTYQEMVELTLAGVAAREASADLEDTPNPTPEQNEIAQETVTIYGKIARLSQRMHLLKFAAASDQAHDYIGDTFLVKAYPDSPRLFTVGWERNDQEDTESISFDLLRNRIRTITYPGQTAVGSEAFLFWRGLLDMAIEHEILQEAAPEPAISVGAVFNQAITDNIGLERITVGTLDKLAVLPISEEAKARITTALTENTDSYVLVPVEMVTLAGAPEPTIGWLEIDNETLEVIDTMENGQHMVAVNYSALAEFSVKAGSFIGGFSAGFFGHTMGFWIGFFEQMPLGNQDIELVIASAKNTAATWGQKAEDACNDKADEEWCKRGVAAGNAVGSAVLAKADPPLQEALFVLPLDTPYGNEETAVSISQAASLTGKSINATVTTQMIGVAGESSHNWTTAGQNSFAFDSLSVGSADVYQNGNLVASGAVTAASTGSATASAQTDGSAINVTGSADGTLALYAPALTDLGGGSQFDSYNFNLNAGSNYTLALSDATVTVNGTDYSGDNLELVTSNPTQLSGSGATAVPNFATTATFTPNSGGLIVADAAGTLTVGGSSVSAVNGFVLADVSEQGSITPTGSDDTFTFNGNADFFALDLSSDSSTIPANTSTNFDADIVANFTDSYTLTVHAPTDWDVAANANGLVTAQPPTGAAAGDYTVVVTAQSETYPDLFVSAVHVVTVTAVDGVTVSVVPDPAFTIPWGPAYDVINFDTMLGRLQIPNAAFAATIQNSSSVARTFDITVTGLPAGWPIFGGELGNTTLSLPLEAGETVQVGLYISPTNNLPAIGAAYPFNITAVAQDNGAVTAVGSETFTMPAIAYPALTVSQSALYAAPNSDASFDVTVTNIGNTAGDFNLLSTVPVADWSVSTLQSPISLAPGASASQPVTVTVTNGDPGVDYPVGIGSSVPTLPYTPTTAVNIYLVSALTEPIYQAASCTLDSDALSAALISLAGAVGELENSCNDGNCDLAKRDAVVEAMRSVALYARNASALVTSTPPLEALADTLASHDDDVDIEADLDALTAVITDLGTELCQIEQYAPSARFTPYVDAVLLGDTANFKLAVTNDGALATTYAITVTGLPDGDQTFNEAIAPGATVNLAVDTTPATLGNFNITASIVPVVPGETLNMAATAVSRLNVVDKFVQVTQVQPDPAFVETGTSSSIIHAEINNVAGIGQDVAGRTAVFAPNGTQLFTGNTSLSLLVGNPRSYELSTVDTSGWAEGVYTVTVDLLDDSDTLIPDGSGYGHLSVGQGLGISHAVAPGIVSPGTVTVTTVITTELLNETVFAEAGVPETVGKTASVETESVVETVPETAPAPLAILSGTAVSRTQDISPTIVYTGSWSVINNIFATAASDGSYTVSSTGTDVTAFTFTGSWVHIGFLKDRTGGQAEIFIDGNSQGIVDLYHPNALCLAPVCLESVAYAGLAAGSHTLEIVVLGTAHINSIGTQVRLDYIDTWDGTTYPDGTFEEDDPRVWGRDGVWSTIADTAASGGTFKQAADTQSAWFPFTGDSVSFVGFARYDTHRVKVAVDGVWQGDVLLYSGTPISRTYSFAGFGAGPHILQVSGFRGDNSIDAFITPAVGPDYDPPSYTGLVRYEEDHPALTYNGYTFNKRPQSWTTSDAAQDSEYSHVQSSTVDDNVSLTFDGSWLNIGLRTRNQGGLAEVFIDGLSYGTIDSYTPGEDVVSAQYDLITGTHTLTLTVLGQSGDNGGTTVYLDYLEFWDGTSVSDAFENAQKGEENGRLHVSSSARDEIHANAIQGDWLSSGLPNSNSNVWYSFVGDGVTLYGFTKANGGSADVYVDNQLVDTVSFEYPFSEQPYTFHYSGFGAGPHVMRVHNIASMRVDGFESNPSVQSSYQPIVEWHESDHTAGASIWGGLHVPPAVGDVTGDGQTEIVVASSNVDNNGELFLLHGDGHDSGDGDPIIWSVPYNIVSGFDNVGAPAIAELDGQPGAEIIHATSEGIYVYHSDGSLYWSNETYNSHVFFAAPAVGNLDLDAEPEIVVNMGDLLVVFEADGTVAWENLMSATASMPLLADLTNDGLLDILVHESGTGNIYAYDYNLGTPMLAWTQTVTTALSIYGAPAVADIDGLQPGGDAGPEVAIASNGWLHVLNGEDGSFVWSEALDAGDSSGVSIADVDGDDEVELITGIDYNGGMIYAVNADGSLLWSAPGLDNSPLNPSLFDLNGDGVYEITFNGADQGLTIFNGPDGTVLFNEPDAGIVSKTGSDYPLFADVDGDDHGELVVASQGGLRVFGWDAFWGPARPLWNQHSYHVTNILDDLTTPMTEPNSWSVHNTYRTQWPESTLPPIYEVTVTHTVGLDNVTVLTDTFSNPPNLSNDPAYRWDYTQVWTQPIITRTFDSVVSNLQPGETRMVAQETAVFYQLPSGTNQITLPPLYITAAHLGELSPVNVEVVAGGTAVYTLTLTNPSDSADTIGLVVGGVPSEWLTYPPSTNLNPGETVTVTVNVVVPSGVDPDTLPLFFDISSSGGIDNMQGSLTIINGLDVTIMLASQTAFPDEPTAYTLALTNHEAVQRTYTLTGTGLVTLDLPTSVTVAGNGMETAVFTATASAPSQYPFTIEASAISGASDSADGVLEILDAPQAALTLTPDPAVAGPLSTAVLTLTVENLSSVAEIFDLQLAVPAGWGGSLRDNSGVVDSVSVPPAPFNSAELMVWLVPDGAAVSGSYPVTVTAVAQSSGAVAGSVVGTVEVVNQGVYVEFTAGPASFDPRDPATWDIQVTNTGNAADTFDLDAAGVMAAAGSLSINSVSLGAGASQTVQLSVDGLDSVLPQTYLVNVAATSQADDRIADDDTTSVNLTDYEAVQVGWLPAAQTVTDTLTAQFTLLITNTGNVSTMYDLETATSATLSAGVLGATSSLPINQLAIPAHSTMQVVVTVDVPEGGVYMLTGMADSQNSSATDSSQATLTVVITNQAPVVDAGVGQTMDEGTAVSFNGTASDPDNDPFDILWNFGDGSTSTSSLTPNHTFGDNGVYNVTLTITDSGSLANTDAVLITVNNVAPSVNAGANLTGNLNQAIQFNGSFIDPGTLDTHTIDWDFGDGQNATGSLTPSHIYTTSGEHTVTLTVTDDDGGVSSDTLTVLVEYQVLLPIILKP